MEFFDSHAHYNDEKFKEERDELIKNIYSEGVTRVINAGYSLESSKKALEIAKKYDFMNVIVGISPNDIQELKKEDLQEIEDLAKNKKVVAIGEIGLDYYWQPYDKKKQNEVFIKQIELAKECKLPISIHSRDATFDMLSVLKDNKDKLTYGAVMHCFSGSKETAAELLKLGLYISFAGPLTFKNANAILEVAKFVPDDMCLTETDSPYLSPHPLRGKVNGPKNVGIILAKLAEIKGTTIEKLAPIIMKNAKTLFYKL